MDSKGVSDKTLEEVISHFGCSLENSTISPLGNGLINWTFLVKSTVQSFVLQRINHHVFKKPLQVINNAELISEHLCNKQRKGEFALAPISQVKTEQGEVFVQVDGAYWRALEYIPKCYTVESIEEIEQAEQAGSAFAQFTAALSDFSAESLSEIIPNFHNLQSRLDQLTEAVKNNAANRLTSCQNLVDYCFAQKAFIDGVASISAQLPMHVTHNDTKINNLLFGSDEKAPVAVIDLDTCMPGFLMNDFGDMVRTCCSTEPEDGKNLAAMSIKFDVFMALASSYVKGFDGKITPLELKSLVIGAQLLPFMIGVRFLTDYINGDVYFHAAHSEHNIDRAKNQIHLYKLLSAQESKLSEIVHAGQAVMV
jgi:Ser/Thr protein kinase RdoA (MazF antagonist)